VAGSSAPPGDQAADPPSRAPTKPGVPAACSATHWAASARASETFTGRGPTGRRWSGGRRPRGRWPR
jgi:hypothetical protein